jgi:hypothetical protein
MVPRSFSLLRFQLLWSQTCKNVMHNILYIRLFPTFLHNDKTHTLLQISNETTVCVTDVYAAV